MCGLIQRSPFLSGWTSLDRNLWTVPLVPPLIPCCLTTPSPLLISSHCSFPQVCGAVKVTDRTEKAVCQPCCLSPWELPRAVEKAAQHNRWPRNDQTERQDPIAHPDHGMQYHLQETSKTVGCPRPSLPTVYRWLVLMKSPQLNTFFLKLSQLCTPSHLPLVQH